MKAQGTFVLGGIFLIFNGALGRALPDFYTDEDLNAWHRFGLRSFYGPWTVIARKPNGDFVSYADYGARVPSDFRPISSSPVVDSFAAESPSQELTSGYETGRSDFVAGQGVAPYSVALFANEVPSPGSPTDSSVPNLSALLPSDILREKNFATGTDAHDSVTKATAATDESKNSETKRDTLELIGIVGVISEDSDSVESDELTTPSSAATSELENDDYGSTTTTDQTIDDSSS